MAEEMVLIIKLCKHLGIEVVKKETDRSVQHRKYAARMGSVLNSPREYDYELKGGDE